MRRLRYLLLDVFTDQKFGGNPLAVFLNGRGLPQETMQRIARELNLSETTFILPPDDPTNHYKVKIFTPTMELPMAGHPTIGTSYAIALEQMVELSGERIELRLEEGVGLIPVTVDLVNGAPTLATMRLLLPEFGPVYEDRQLFADLLSLEVSDFDERYPIQVVSCGVPAIFAPIKTRAAIERIQLRLDIASRVLSNSLTEMFVFTQDTVLPTSQAHSRMFAPPLGIPEDPATGAANGPLGCYLVYYGIVQGSPAVIVNEQGFEMGRPSLLTITIEQAQDAIRSVYVGGQSVLVGEGALFV